ncbi:MAG: transposase [Planctomycetes bacterium]|nr:transposase [Planctomycetota bacterium]
MRAAFDISRHAYYAARWPRERPVAAQRPKGPPARPYVSVEVLRPAIQGIVDEHPAWGVRKVWATLRRRELCVARRRVWALTKAMGFTLKPDRVRDPDAPRGHVTMAKASRRWATDLTPVRTPPASGVRRSGLPRAAPPAARSRRRTPVRTQQESTPIPAPVRASLLREFGLVENVPDGLELRTDHGPQYTGSDCDALCASWRLEHTLAPVGWPTGSSVADRVIRTLEEEVVWLRDWNSLAELQEALDHWLVVHNHVRPHQALDWKTPAEKRAESLGLASEVAA